MFNQNGTVISKGAHALACLVALLLVAWVGWMPGLRLDGQPQSSIQVVTNQITYNAGDPVRVKLMLPTPPADSARIRYVFSIRYRGDEKPVAEGLSLGSMDGAFPGYHLLWR